MSSNVCTQCPAGEIRPAGDDAAGPDTSCRQKQCTCEGGTASVGVDCPGEGAVKCAFPDRNTLRAAVESCLATVPSGDGCCSLGANCGPAMTGP